MNAVADDQSMGEAVIEASALEGDVDCGSGRQSVQQGVAGTPYEAALVALLRACRCCFYTASTQLPHRVRTCSGVSSFAACGASETGSSVLSKGRGHEGCLVYETHCKPCTCH